MMNTVIVDGFAQWHRNGLMLYELAGPVSAGCTITEAWWCLINSVTQWDLMTAAF